MVFHMSTSNKLVIIITTIATIKMLTINHIIICKTTDLGFFNKANMSFIKLLSNNGPNIELCGYLSSG